MPFFRRFRFLALCLPVLCCACATTRPVEVVEKKDFIEMARIMRTEMQARHLLDKDGFYMESFSPAQDTVAYGDILYRQLSPSFMFDDTAGHVYLGESFHATLTPGSRVRRQAHGFTIFHPTQTLRVAMLAIADWNDDGEKEWIVSCRVTPLRGGRTRDYYLLVPPPNHPRERLIGTVAAVNDCFGLACTLYVKKTAAPQRENDIAATPVEDVAPGLENVTEAPAAAGSGRTRGGLEERSL